MSDRYKFAAADDDLFRPCPVSDYLKDYWLTVDLSDSDDLSKSKCTLYILRSK
jgi:hypothetical protein